MLMVVVMKIGNNMKGFSKTTIGEGHNAEQKPCQDCSLCYTLEEGLSVALVSDGHGGKPYFRSHIGSKKACNVALDAIKDFFNDADESSFVISGKDAVRILPLTAADYPGKLKPAEEQLRQLANTIIQNWRKEVAKDAADSELNEWEKSNVAQEYIDQLNDSDKLFRVYGCTLMAFISTPSYWFAIHLGDGKCFGFYGQDSGKVWDEPIPWDERCFLNKTTSLCASDAYESFRFAYGGRDSMPLAVFLGSDGLDDTFADNDSLCDFYIKILKEILFSSQESVESELEASLHELSRCGSLDDMSVACLYDESRLVSNIGYILEHQIDLVTSRITSSERRVNELITRKLELEHYLEVRQKFDTWNKEKKELEKKLGVSSNTKIDIEIKFAEKDIVREEKHREQLSRKKSSLVSERPKIEEISIKEEKVVPIDTSAPATDGIEPDEKAKSEEVVLEETPVAGQIYEDGSIESKGLAHIEPHYINET